MARISAVVFVRDLPFAEFEFWPATIFCTVGASLPAVRIELNPNLLASFGISLPTVQKIVAGQNSNSAKGQIADENTTADILANDQISKAVDYKPLVVGYHDGGVVCLEDVAEVNLFAAARCGRRAF